MKPAINTFGTAAFIIGAAAVLILKGIAAAAGTAAFFPVLTPPSSSSPQINGPRLVGVRPGNPLLYTIPATGDRPMRFSGDNLPEGITVDATTGRMMGAIVRAGNFRIMPHATSAHGTAQREFTLAVGDRIVLPLPMGWNTYYPFRINISDTLVRQQAAAMVSSGLINHGWSYISIDEGWENKGWLLETQLTGPGRAADGAITPNKKFPDMAGLCGAIHGMGLKAGIYSSPGPLCCGGSVGSYQHEDQDARLFAEWGVDYVKYGW